MQCEKSDEIRYTGQTKRNIDVRFKEHLRNSIEKLEDEKCPVTAERFIEYWPLY